MRRLITIFLVLAAGAAHAGIAEMAPKIVDNATSTGAHPLPLASAWITGGNQAAPNDWLIANQLDLIDQGYYLLPIADWGEDASHVSDATITELDTYGLPISFRFNNMLSTTAGTAAAKETAPGVYSNFYASPYGSIADYQAAGQAWVDDFPRLSTWASIYPDPPLVILLDNNEWSSLAYADRAEDIRSTATLTLAEWYGKWADRRRAMSDTITSATGWSSAVVKTVAYESSPVNPELGRTDNGVDYDFPNSVKTSALYFDGGSFPYYLNDWQPDNCYYKIWSPQSNAMNIRWGLDNLAEYAMINDGWWQEQSTWFPKTDSGLIANYAEDGQAMTDNIHRAWVTWGMWVIRPRVVRPFYSSTSSFSVVESQYMGVLETVKQVNDNSTLRRFWTDGVLTTSTLAYTENEAMNHPYRYQQQYERMYMLEVPENGLTAIATGDNSYYSPSANVKVWALALTDDSDVLVYAFAPLGAREGVEINVPGYGKYEMDIATTGTYAVLSTAGVTNQAPVVDAGPALSIVRPATSTVVSGATATDDWLPQTDDMTYLWTCANASVTITNQTTLTPTIAVTGALPDGATLVLTADDGDLRTSDTTTVVLADAPSAADLVPSAFDRVAPIVIPAAKVGAGGYGLFLLLGEESLPAEIWDYETSGTSVRFAANKNGTGAYYVDCIQYDTTTTKSLFAVGPTVTLSDSTTNTLYVFYGIDTPPSNTASLAYPVSLAAFIPCTPSVSNRVGSAAASYATAGGGVTQSTEELGVYNGSAYRGTATEYGSVVCAALSRSQTAASVSFLSKVLAPAGNITSIFSSNASTRGQWIQTTSAYNVSSFMGATRNTWAMNTLYSLNVTNATVPGYSNKLYRDGETIGSPGTSNLTAYYAGSFYTPAYKGYTAGIKWWNIALTAGQVTTLHNMEYAPATFAIEGTPEDTPEPAAGWHRTRGPRSPIMRMRRGDR